MCADLPLCPHSLLVLAYKSGHPLQPAPTAIAESWRSLRFVLVPLAIRRNSGLVLPAEQA